MKVRKMSGRRVVLAFIGGAVIGGIIVWFVTRRRFESIEQRLQALENRVAIIENRILEFQATYYERVADIEYQYSILRREIEQLKSTALNEERKKDLDEWLEFLERVKEQKTQEVQQKRKEPTTYVS